MHNMLCAPHIKEGVAMNMIFDACRANEKRRDFHTEDGHVVTFTYKENDEHLAIVKDSSGTVVALAYVDSTDC